MYLLVTGINYRKTKGQQTVAVFVKKYIRVVYVTKNQLKFVMIERA